MQDAPGESIAPAAREDGNPPDTTAAASGAQDAPDKPGASAAREGDGPPEDENLPEGENPSESSRRTRRLAPWVRRPGSGAVAIDLAAVAPGRPTRFDLPDSGGLAVVCLVRPTRVQALGGSRAARAVSLFTVNRRPPAPDGDGQDAAFAFQVEMHVEADRPLIPRVNLNGLDSADWDERLADLHYRDVAEYAVGHNVSTRADLDGGDCRRVRTEWMPQAGVPRVEPSAIGTVEFGMEALGGLDGAPAAKSVPRTAGGAVPRLDRDATTGRGGVHRPPPGGRRGAGTASGPGGGSHPGRHRSAGRSGRARSLPHRQPGDGCRRAPPAGAGGREATGGRRGAGVASVPACLPS